MRNRAPVPSLLSLFLSHAKMDLINTIMNLVLPPTALLSLFPLLPPFYFFKLILAMFSTLFPEDTRGKVDLITGASSGIGEYAMGGALLAVAARREGHLQEVAERARELGAPDVLVIPADVCKYDECKQFVEKAVNHFGDIFAVDHLVANAGIINVSLFEDVTDVTDFNQVMAIKAAMMEFYETVRVELGPEINITVVTPGWIESEMSTGKFLSNQGQMIVDRGIRRVDGGAFPVASTKGCAKAVVNGACRGERYVTDSSWYKVIWLYKAFAPEVLEWYYRLHMYMTRPAASPRDAPSKRILDSNDAENFLLPSSAQSLEVKRE